MANYARLYRFGITPWERCRTTATASIAALLDREEAERSRPFGRALDLGCGRWSEVHRRRKSRPALRAGRCSRSSRPQGGPGLADGHDRAAMVPAAPTELGGR
jgi:hypothetical protein